MADQEPPTTRRERAPHFLSRPDPLEAGPATIRETPEPPPLSPIGGAELLAAAGILSAATQALGGALGSMALVRGAAAIMLAGNLAVLARRVPSAPLIPRLERGAALAGWNPVRPLHLRAISRANRKAPTLVCGFGFHFPLSAFRLPLWPSGFRFPRSVGLAMPRQKADPELLRQAMALVAEGLSPSDASERLGRKISKTTIYAALAQARGAEQASPAEVPPDATEADAVHPETGAASSLLASEHLPGSADPEDGRALLSSPAAPPTVSPAREPAPAPPTAPLAPSPHPTPAAPLSLPPGEDGAADAGAVAPSPAPASAEAPPGNGMALPGRARPGPGRRCACCSSEHRQEIDRLLCQGASYKAIEARLAPDGPSDDSIEHHARRCIPHLLGARAEELRTEVLTTVRARAERLMGKAERLVEEAEGSVLCTKCQGPTEPASPRDRAATINAANSVIVTLGKLLGELGAEVDVRVILASPHWAQYKRAIALALLPYPEAAEAVAVALEGLPSGGKA